MGKLTLFPTYHEKLYKRIGHTVEERIAVLNHGPELAQLVRNTVNATIKEFGSKFEYRGDFTNDDTFSEDQIEKIKLFAHDVGKHSINLAYEIFMEVVKLRIEMCEHMYECNKKRGGLRIVKPGEG